VAWKSTHSGRNFPIFPKKVRPPAPPAEKRAGSGKGRAASNHLANTWLSLGKLGKLRHRRRKAGEIEEHPRSGNERNPIPDSAALLTPANHDTPAVSAALR